MSTPETKEKDKDTKASMPHEHSKSKPSTVLELLDMNALGVRSHKDDTDEPRTALIASRATPSQTAVTDQKVISDPERELEEVIQRIKAARRQTEAKKRGVTVEELDEYDFEEHSGSEDYGVDSSDDQIENSVQEPPKQPAPLRSKHSLPADNDSTTEQDNNERTFFFDDSDTDDNDPAITSPTHPDDRRETCTEAVYDELLKLMIDSAQPSPALDSEYEENMRKAESVGLAKRAKKGKRNNSIDFEDDVVKGK